jgi:hypothetical protein
MAAEQKRSGLLHFIAANLDTVAVILKYFLPASLTGALVGWATWVAGLFQQYAPASWVIAGILGALVGALIMLVAAFARERIQMVKFRNWVFSAHQINPLDAMFNSRRIRLVDLAPPIGPFITGKTFIDCEIIGPANIMFSSCHFQQCGGEVVDGIVIKAPFQPSNGFGFKNCTFTRCKFYLLTFMITEADFQFFYENHGGLNWITERPNEPPLPIGPGSTQLTTSETST